MPARLEAINNDLQHRREAKTRGGETMGLAGAFEVDFLNSTSESCGESSPS